MAFTSLLAVPCGRQIAVRDPPIGPSSRPTSRRPRSRRLLPRPSLASSAPPSARRPRPPRFPPRLLSRVLIAHYATTSNFRIQSARPRRSPCNSPRDLRGSKSLTILSASFSSPLESSWPPSLSVSGQSTQKQRVSIYVQFVSMAKNTGDVRERDPNPQSIGPPCHTKGMQEVA